MIYIFFKYCLCFALDDVVQPDENLPEQNAKEQDLEEDPIDDEHVSLRVSIGFKSLRSRSSTGLSQKSHCYKASLKDFISGISLSCRHHSLTRCLP